ncbi:MAG: universal stress protein [Acidobacteriota bacterium]
MRSIQKILFPTDFSETSQQAMAWAIFLAQQHEAELLVLHATVLHGEEPGNPVYHLADAEAAYRVAESAAGERMQEIFAAHEDHPLSIRILQRRGISADGIVLDFAREEEVDLIVMGTHGRRGLGRLILGSVTEAVVREAPCPVVTLRGGTEDTAHEGNALEDIQRIVVPLDFSAGSQQALAEAKELAAVYGAQLDLIHVVQPLAYPQSYFPGATSAYVADYAAIGQQAKASLQRIAEEHGLEGASVHVTEGYPATAIVDYAKRHGADLIVLSTHGLTGVAHLFLGSVAEKVVRLAECPVWTVRGKGSES